MAVAFSSRCLGIGRLHHGTSDMAVAFSLRCLRLGRLLRGSLASGVSFAVPCPLALSSRCLGPGRLLPGFSAKGELAMPWHRPRASFSRSLGLVRVLRGVSASTGASSLRCLSPGRFLRGILPPGAFLAVPHQGPAKRAPEAGAEAPRRRRLEPRYRDEDAPGRGTAKKKPALGPRHRKEDAQGRDTGKKTPGAGAP